MQRPPPQGCAVPLALLIFLEGSDNFLDFGTPLCWCSGPAEGCNGNHDQSSPMGDWRTSKYLFVNTAHSKQANEQAFNPCSAGAVVFSKLKPQHLGFNCSTGTLK